MDKLYLIRVDMERFLGPYTFRQVKEAYLRMEFGLQDEISGSLRQWVAFDDFEGIRRHYPELVQLVQREMLSGWGISAQSNLGGPIGQTKVKKPSSRKKPKGLLVFLLLAALVMGAIGLLLAREGPWPNLLGMVKDRQIYNAKTLYGDRYNVRFEAFMDRNHDFINQALKHKKTQLPWRPYVRAVAFEKDGRWEGVTAKKIRGNAAAFLPGDCSMPSWEQRWSQSREQWSKFLSGLDFPQQDWAMLLAMDPHWVQSRSPAAGWLTPGSYAEGCLRMGLKALQRLPMNANVWEAKVFIARLRWQLGVINGKGPDEDFEMSGALWALSCIEDSVDDAAMRNCMNSVVPKLGWREVFDMALQRRHLEFLVNQKPTLDSEQLAELQVKLAEFIRLSANYPIAYDAEIKFFQEVVEQQGNVQQAKNSLNQRNSQLNPGKGFSYRLGWGSLGEPAQVSGTFSWLASFKQCLSQIIIHEKAGCCRLLFT